MGSRSPAGPRRLGTATRMSASLSQWLSAFFGRTPDQAPKAAKFAILTPGRAGFPNRAKRSEGSDSAPIRNARVSPCEPLCARLGAGVACVTRRSPLKRALRRLWAMCEKPQRILLRRWKTEPLGMVFCSPAKSRFGGFRPLFARSIKAQDKGPQSLMRAARPQSPAVRGFSGKRKPQSVWRFYRIIAVGHPAKSRVCRALRRF